MICIGPGAVKRAQSGATLLVSMIFLVVLTLIVVSAIKVSNVNSKVAGNMQAQREAEAAAQETIEKVISTDFTTLATPSPVTVDINNSGAAGSTYSVDLNPLPTCVSVSPIKSVDLDAGNPADVPCYASGSVQNSGISGGAGNGDSMCANSNWEITASTTPPNAAVSATPAVTVRQGVATRVAVGSACN
ncbi:PilX N-terminal [Variovorax sp. YR216]|nr:PilX N-terminal [Variovorax sp. YR216]